LRELREETNVRSASFLAEAPDCSATICRRMSPKNPAAIRGQTQKWFALRFTGAESEIDINTPDEGRHKAEFDAWRWEKLERLPEFDRAVQARGLCRRLRAIRPSGGVKSRPWLENAFLLIIRAPGSRPPAPTGSSGLSDRARW